MCVAHTVFSKHGLEGVLHVGAPSSLEDLSREDTIGRQAACTDYSELKMLSSSELYHLSSSLLLRVLGNQFLLA